MLPALAGPVLLAETMAPLLRVMDFPAESEMLPPDPLAEVLLVILAV